jgi:hypothetical protein
LREKALCTDAGWRFLRETARLYERDGAIVAAPTFRYSGKLDTCTCKFVVRNANGGLQLWLYDTLTNHDLAAYIAGPDGKQLSAMSKEQFESTDREIIGETKR